MVSRTKEMLKRQKKEIGYFVLFDIGETLCFLPKKKYLTASLEEDGVESVYLTFNR